MDISKKYYKLFQTLTHVLSEQACCGDATWVKGSKCDSSFFMVSSVEFLHCKHVADFAVLVSLGAIKGSSIYHG